MTRTIPLTEQSAVTIEKIRESGDFDAAMYALSRVLSLIDQTGNHMERANCRPYNRDGLPDKVRDVLTALAYSKRILLEIQRVATEQDKVEEMRVQAMARGDQTRVAQMCIQAVELRHTLHHLCRSFDVKGDGDDGA